MRLAVKMDRLDGAIKRIGNSAMCRGIAEDREVQWRMVLTDLRTRLKNGEPVRLVATSLIDGAHRHRLSVSIAGGCPPLSLPGIGLWEPRGTPQMSVAQL